MSQILKNLPVGSYAVIFPSISSGVDEEGHEKMLAELYDRVRETEGFLGLDHPPRTVRSNWPLPILIPLSP